MSIKCRRPLLNICGDVSRITIGMGQCSNCPPEVVSLRIEQAGCAVIEQYCEEVVVAVGCACGDPVTFTDTKISQRVVPKVGVTYPLHEINMNGEAVFALDGKFSAMGPGRYVGIVSFGECGHTLIDINYTCGDTRMTRITATNAEGC